MSKEEIRTLIDNVAHCKIEVSEAVSQLHSYEDIIEACVYCKSCIDNAYDHEGVEYGDNYAKALMFIKIHGINNLDGTEKFNFISKQL